MRGSRKGLHQIDASVYRKSEGPEDLIRDSFKLWGYLVIFCSAGELPHTQVYFYDTAAGAEIDLVLTVNGKLWANEVKHSTTPKLTKGFHLACQDIKPDNKFVVYSGKEKFKTKDG